MAGLADAANNVEEEAEGSVLGLALGEDSFGDFRDEGHGERGAIVLMNVEKGFEDFALADADEVAGFTFVEPDAKVGERLEGGAETALGPARALSDPAQAAVIPRQERDEAVGITERVGTQDDGLGVVERHGKN